MKHLKLSVILCTMLLVAGCGIRGIFWTLEDRMKEAEKYLADRNFTAEGVGHGYMKVRDDIGARANDLREYMSDRGFSTEGANRAFNNFNSVMGKRFKVIQKYLYDRGLCEIRHGDYCGSSKQPSDNSDSNGSDGSAGSAGNSGNNGTAGNSGTNGKQGPIGVPGTSGEKGTVGSAGPTGSPGSSVALGPKPVDLGVAGNFTLLSKSGITNVPDSIVVGDIGASPITGASITALDCVQVVGNIYTVDAAGPACRSQNSIYLTTAVADMQTAYTDAAGRSNPDFVELGAGEIGGMTLTPGLYKWSGNLSISSNVTLKGGSNDVFIMQIAGTLNEASSVNVVLDGVQAKNVFWQVASTVNLSTSAHMEGTILCATNAALLTGATLDGRILAQTAITLQTNVVNKP